MRKVALLIEKLILNNRPMICLGEEVPVNGFSVTNDDAASASLVADHLLQRNFQSFGYIGLDGYVWSDTRRDQFVQHLADAGFPCAVFETSAETRRDAPWSVWRRKLSTWIEHLPKPVAVMACYDATARTLLDVCHELSILVPEQVSIVGVDNDEVLCELSDPPLTSVALDTAAIGWEAARLLDQWMDGQPPGASIVVPPREIIARRSTELDASIDPELTAAMGFIRRYACDGIDVSDVLRNTPFSRRTLERRFRETFDHTPLDVIRRVRLDRVKLLLRETDLKLDTIAEKSGFRYSAHMVSQFRRTQKMTPGQFRKLQREE